MRNIKNSDELFPVKSQSTDITRILTNYLKYWYIFLIGIIISIGGAFIYLRYNTVTQYQVATRLLIKDEKSATDISGMSAFSDLEMFKSVKNTDNEILILHSKTLLKRVINELDLGARYYIEGKFQELEIYGEEVPIKLVPKKIKENGYYQVISLRIKDRNSFQLDGKDYKYGEVIQHPYGTFMIVPSSLKTLTEPYTAKDINIRIQNTQELSNYYHKAIGITQESKNASVLKLELTDVKPERAKDILDKLVELYNEDAVEDKNAIAKNTLEFIDERLKFLTVELSGVEKNVEQYKSRNEVTDVSSQASDYLAQAGDYNKQLSEWAIQIDVLKSIEQYLRKSKNQYRMVPSTLGIQDQTLVVLIGKFNELQLERERMLRTANPESPLIHNTNEQLENLRINILENLSNIKRSLMITSSKLEKSSGKFESKIKKVPQIERELLVINRQQSIKQNLYLYLLQKREETALNLAASISPARIIDAAMIEGHLILPNKSSIYLMALILGLSLPFAGIYIKNLLNNKINTKLDVENYTNTPILGELCTNTSGQTIVVQRGNRTPIVEMIRHIRAKIHYSAVDAENKVILITSSMSGEGKTFFAINLAASLALLKKKVLIIDLDLRKPNILKGLGMKEGIGICDYIVSKDLPIYEVIRPVESIPDLSIISSGPIPPDPAELIMSPKLEHLIDELKQSFDHIIIDTSPVGQVADALSLNNIVDSTIFIMRYNYTYKKQLDIINDISENKLLKRPMIVLNDAKEADTYGYGYGYGEDTKSAKTKKAYIG